jgi:hypothetical protein
MFKRSDQEIRELFFKLSSRKDVSDILEISDRSLRYFLYVKNPQNLYRKIILKKKDGSDRIIYSPDDKLKQIQRKLAYILNLIYERKPCTYGFVKSENIVNNAKNHIKKRLILNIDLKDFFTQIHFGRVRGMLLKPPYGISEEAATTISQIVCYNGALPQGAPTSPILTNMICKPLDNALIKLSKKYGVNYSRYADDITFSTYRNDFPKNIIDGDVTSLIIGKELEQVLSKNSFVVNTNKIFLNSTKNRQEVTGLVVNRFPNVKREFVNKLRVIIYDCKKHGVYPAAQNYIQKGLCKNGNIKSKYNDEKYKEQIIEWFKNVLKGKINFIKQVKGVDCPTFLNFAVQLNELFDKKIFDTSLFDAFLDRITKNVVVLEFSEGEKHFQGSGFYIRNYGLFTSYHVTENSYFYKVYRYNEYPERFVDCISKGYNEIKSDKSIDYALYIANDEKYGIDNWFDLGDSRKLKIGDPLTVIGYPNFNKGNSATIQRCEIIGEKIFMGAPLYTVSARIVHGSSGGVVLNNKGQVVGMIKAGIVTLDEDDTNENQGFIPMHVILDHYGK